jgi:predicted branched-subunit amino acid permease
MGVALDLMATLCMILGSSHGPLTLHGCLGYSALLFMLVDMIWILRFESRSGREEQIPGKLLYISVAAYSWWVLAFLAGAMLAMRMPH